MIVRSIFPVLWALAFAVLGWTSSGDPEPVRRTAGARTRWIEVRVPPQPAMTDDLVALAVRLYGWNCMPCHGAEGKGDGPMAERLGLRPGNFTRGCFKLKTSAVDELPFDEDLYRTLSTGIPSAGMPGFAGFEPDEQWALVELVKSLAYPHFDHFPPQGRALLPPPPLQADRAAGERLFREGAGCAICHGQRGKGDGRAAASLVDLHGRPVSPPDMTRGELTFKSGDGPDDVFRILTTGMPGSPMPAFDSIPERDRWDLAFYVTTLFEPIAAGERVYWRMGCGHCHSIGHGRLVGPDLAGVTERRKPDWLREWLRDPPRILLDPALRNEFGEYPTPMPNLNLTEADIELLVSFLHSVPAPPKDSR